MRRGNVQAVVGRTKRGGEIGAAARAYALAACAHLEAFLLAEARAGASSLVELPSSSHVEVTLASPVASSPEAWARGPPIVQVLSGTELTAHKD